MKRRKFITLIGGIAIALPLASYAQQPQPAPPKRIGYLSRLGCPIAPEHPVPRRLVELGWVEGRTSVLECVSWVGPLDQLPALARELVSRRPDVLIAGPTNFVSALKGETTTIPIVMLGGWEPVRLGFITSLARPGGNVTGVAWLGLLPKQMELLKEIVPNLRSVAYITGVKVGAYTPSEAFKINTELLIISANTLGITWQILTAVVATDYDEIFARLAAEHFDAAYIASNEFNENNQARICQLALRHRIPAVSETAAWARDGLLLSYGQDFPWTAARAMEYVDKILRGAKPSELPVEQATKFELAINLNTAKTLGLTVPPSLISRADEVIE
jgi:putative tryptophan/tyrosine transport system substrate-binding protein